ncbi:hypothetical protein LTR56_020596 [Elasticomyces elasticus]|nr:hypothetical protein LTR56_020596 [Elasticomyces elasticus]KAK4909285.1 hypothetical protein LTR49_021955 [Elasticomyces elasticus]
MPAQTRAQTAANANKGKTPTKKNQSKNKAKQPAKVSRPKKTVKVLEPEKATEISEPKKSASAAEFKENAVVREPSAEGKKTVVLDYSKVNACLAALPKPIPKTEIEKELEIEREKKWDAYLDATEVGKRSLEDLVALNPATNERHFRHLGLRVFRLPGEIRRSGRRRFVKPYPFSACVASTKDDLDSWQESKISAMAVTRSQSAGKATAKPATATKKKSASTSKLKKSASVPKSKKTSKARKVVETTEANENTDWAGYSEESHDQFMAESDRRREEADKRHQEFMDNLRREDEARMAEHEARMADMEARSLKRRADREARMSARKAEREARRAEWEFPSPYVKKESERLMHELYRKHLRGRGSSLDKEAWNKAFEKCREEYLEAMEVVERREREMKAGARDAEASVHPEVEERGGS